MARTGVVGVIRAGRRQTARSGCAPTWTRCRSRRRPALPHAVAEPRRDARLRPRRPHDDAARRGEIPRRDAQLRRHRLRDLPAGRGDSGRRARSWSKDGLFERCPMEMVFGLHNWPQIAGRHVRSGATARSWRRWPRSTSRSPARARHGAFPHQGVDPIVVAAQIVTALQTIVSRNDRADRGRRRHDRPHLRRRHLQRDPAGDACSCRAPRAGSSPRCRRSAGSRACAGWRPASPRASAPRRRWCSVAHYPATVNDPDATDAAPSRRRDGRGRGARDAHARCRPWAARTSRSC